MHSPMRRSGLIGSGRSADVYEIDDAWVLRRYRDGGDARVESVVMTFLADHGYPVPRVQPPAPEYAAGPPPRTDLVMRRLSGPTMLRALDRGTLHPAEAGRVLADLLRRLHALPPRLSADPSARVLHLDLHPDNVMLTPDGPVVIDWRNTEEGPPGLDWSMSALILAQVVVEDDDPAGAARRADARAVLAALLRHAERDLVLGGPPPGHLARVRQRRAADPSMTPREVALLDTATALVRELLDRHGDHDGGERGQAPW